MSEFINSNEDYGFLWDGREWGWDYEWGGPQDVANHSGKQVHINDFRHLKGASHECRRSFEFLCPDCGEEMEPVHCEKRQSHFRHLSKSSHSSETKAHRYAKNHIASILNARGRLGVSKRCAECHKVKQLSTGFGLPLLKSNYDKTYTEKRIGKYTPDVSLYLGDTPVLAIEIANTHKTTSEKIGFYNDIDLPWVELSARCESHFKEIMRWRGGNDLYRCFIKRSGVVPDLCLQCEATAPQREANRLASIAEGNRILREIAEDYESRELARKAKDAQRKAGVMSMVKKIELLSEPYGSLCGGMFLTKIVGLIYKDIESGQSSNSSARRSIMNELINGSGTLRAMKTIQDNASYIYNLLASDLEKTPLISAPALNE